MSTRAHSTAGNVPFRLVELSHVISEHMVTYPGQPGAGDYALPHRRLSRHMLAESEFAIYLDEDWSATRAPIFTAHSHRYHGSIWRFLLSFPRRPRSCERGAGWAGGRGIACGGRTRGRAVRHTGGRSRDAPYLTEAGARQASTGLRRLG